MKKDEDLVGDLYFSQLSQYLINNEDKISSISYSALSGAIKACNNDVFQQRWNMKGISCYVWPSLMQQGANALKKKEYVHLLQKKTNDQRQTKRDVYELGA